MGKIATTTAQMTRAIRVSFTQMMISGAIATIGVTCSSTAYGNRLISIQRLCTNKSATRTPSRTAIASAVSATPSVTPSESSSSARSATSVASTAAGEGTRYGGMS